MGEFIGLVAVTLIFGSPLLAVWTGHQRKMLELKLQLQNQGDVGLRAEVDALRQEVRALRDTSTQYDLSFDTALQRMEKRVEGVERRIVGYEPDPNTLNLSGRR
jgi:hypothetical protein